MSHSSISIMDIYQLKASTLQAISAIQVDKNNQNSELIVFVRLRRLLECGLNRNNANNLLNKLFFENFC